MILEEIIESLVVAMKSKNAGTRVESALERGRMIVVDMS